MGTPRNHSVIKAFRILQAFTTHGSALTAAQVADAAELNAATAHRFLLTLEELGAVQRTGNRRFRLGVAVANLARGVEHSDLIGDLWPPARPCPGRHVPGIGQCRRAARGQDRIRGEGCGRPDRCRSSSHPTARPPLHCSAVGKVLLASPAGPGTRGSPGRARSRRTHAAYDHRAGGAAPGARPGRQAGFRGWTTRKPREGLRCIAVPIRGR